MSNRFNSRDDEDSFIDDNGDHHLANYDSKGRAYYADHSMALGLSKRDRALNQAVGDAHRASEKLAAFSSTVADTKGLGEVTRAFIKKLGKDEILALCISDALQPFARGCREADFEKAKAGNKAAAERALFMMVKDYLYADVQKRAA